MGSSVTINNIDVKSVQKPSKPIGPSNEQTSLKQVMAAKLNGFWKVTARVIPKEVWATSEAAKSYFAKFDRVTLAEVGENPPRSGWPWAFVQFKYAMDRAYKRGIHGEVIGLDEFGLVYDGTEFEQPNNRFRSPIIWYSQGVSKFSNSITKLPYSDHVVVKYKGKEFQLRGIQELFDPETQEIISLTVTELGNPLNGISDTVLER